MKEIIILLLIFVIIAFIGSPTYISAGTYNLTDVAISIRSIRAESLNETKFLASWCDLANKTINIAMYDTSGTIFYKLTNVSENGTQACTTADNTMITHLGGTGYNDMSFVCYMGAANTNIFKGHFFNTLTGVRVGNMIELDKNTGVQSRSGKCLGYNDTCTIIYWWDTGLSGSRIDKMNILCYDGGNGTKVWANDLNLCNNTGSTLVLGLDYNKNNSIVSTCEKGDAVKTTYQQFINNSGAILSNQILYNYSYTAGAYSSVTDNSEVVFLTDNMGITLLASNPNASISFKPFWVNNLTIGDNIYLKDLINSTAYATRTIRGARKNDTTFYVMGGDINSTFTGLYNLDGSIISEIYQINGTNSRYTHYDIISSDTGRDNGLCEENNVVMEIANFASIANWTSYLPDFTDWNGTCASPVIPPNASNATYPWVYNGTGNWVLNCSNPWYEYNTSTNMLGNNISVQGTGRLNISAEIYNVTAVNIANDCYVYMYYLPLTTKYGRIRSRDDT